MILSTLLFFCFPRKLLSEIWEKDMSQDIYIEASRDGFEFISLDCLEKHFQVTLELEEPFDGVFYTRGSYKQGKPPCYFHGDGSTMATLKIPYDECKTAKKGGNYTNTVILQVKIPSHVLKHINDPIKILSRFKLINQILNFVA